MHFCAAVIAIGEDINNTVVRNEFSPVSWPEVEVIRAVHGDSAVTYIRPFVRVTQSPRDERQRLAEIYGDPICASIWGGKSPPREMEAPEATLKDGVTWMNPITGETETTGSADKVEASFDEGEEVPPFDPKIPTGLSAKKR